MVSSPPEHGEHVNSVSASATSESVAFDFLHTPAGSGVPNGAVLLSTSGLSDEGGDKISFRLSRFGFRYLFIW